MHEGMCQQISEAAIHFVASSREVRCSRADAEVASCRSRSRTHARRVKAPMVRMVVNPQAAVMALTCHTLPAGSLTCESPGRGTSRSKFPAAAEMP